MIYIVKILKPFQRLYTGIYTEKTWNGQLSRISKSSKPEFTYHIEAILPLNIGDVIEHLEAILPKSDYVKIGDYCEMLLKVDTNIDFENVLRGDGTWKPEHIVPCGLQLQQQHQQQATETTEASIAFRGGTDR